MSKSESSSVIDRARIEHVARLASLSLSEAEVVKMTADVGGILKHVAELDALNTDDVPPTAHVQIAATAWRKDEVKPCLDREEVLAQAPRAAHDGFAVPAFVEG